MEDSHVVFCIVFLLMHITHSPVAVGKKKKKLELLKWNDPELFPFISTFSIRNIFKSNLFLSLFNFFLQKKMWILIKSEKENKSNDLIFG